LMMPPQQDIEALNACQILPTVTAGREFTLALEWLGMQRGDGYVHALHDGRSPKAAQMLREWATEQYANEKVADPWLIYKPPLVKDPRLPGRKVAFSDRLRETAVFGFSSPLVRMKSKPRPGFAACGEGTTHSLSYPALEIRPLIEIPMLTREAKKAVVGYLPGGYSDKLAPFYEQGEPLLHNDMKPIQYYSAMLRDLDAGHVFDVDLGSGALCIACMMANIGYTGVAHNEGHLNFVDQILDRCMLALLSNEKHGLEGSPEGLAPTMLQQYFGSTIAEGTRFIGTSRAASGTKASESDAGSEASDSDL
jgi:hypothetical protein